MERYDIAIVGTGPAGLEAAITAKIRNKKIILFGENNLSKKVEKAHTVLNYLGLPEVAGEDMMKAFKTHLDNLGIEICENRIVTIYSMGKYFTLQGHNNEFYEAESVILATGLSSTKPFTGELENLGRGVSYCATCDGLLYKGKEVCVIAYSSKDEEEANYLSEVTSKVTYIQMYDGDTNFKENVEVIKNVKPLSMERNDKDMILHLEDKDVTSSCVFILRENIAPSQLVPGLKIINNHVEVDRSLKTNIKGLFACGDITGAPYQYIKAAGEGNVAALSAVSYLAEKKTLEG